MAKTIDEQVELFRLRLKAGTRHTDLVETYRANLLAVARDQQERDEAFANKERDQMASIPNRTSYADGRLEASRDIAAAIRNQD